MMIVAPGPIQIPNIVQEALMGDVPYFASQDFTKFFKTVQPKLQKVFDTKNFVLVGNGSGSLGMEVAVMSFFNPGDAVVVITSGKYGDNWRDMCINHNLKVTTCTASYQRRCYSRTDFEDFCSSCAKNIKGVFVTHFETTSGVLNPIDDYLKIYRDCGGTGLFIVDAISSLLTEPLRSSNYDVVLGASQKALSLPPGLFFISLSDRAWDFAANKCKSIDSERFYYFDLLKEYSYQLKGQSVFTTSVHLIKALDVSLDMVLRRGVPFIINKCRDNASFVRNLLDPYFSRFPKDEGNAVSVFEFDRSPELVKLCYDWDLVVGSGIRDLSENTFRIMNFGWALTTSSMIRTCNIVKSALRRLKD